MKAKLLLILLLATSLLFCMSCGNKKENVDYELESTLSVEELRQQEIKDSMDQVKHIEDVKHSIKILKAKITPSNSVGGHDAIFYFKNVSKKTIKYLTWTASFENAVGDVVENEVGGYTKYSGKYTGPLAPGKSIRSGCWNDVIYNYSAKKMVIEKVYIVYMDGSEVTVSWSELDYLY